MEAIGYSSEDLKHIPEEAIMGLGCGNPTALTGLNKGEVVLDLGSGAGIDVFLAANMVGPTGRVIGIDMTEEMVKKSGSIAQAYNYENVEFRLGEIENLPLDNDSVDVIISNCVINLSPDKDRVFQEAYRVLRPKGRLTVSDIVTERPLPAEIREDLDAWSACIGGAMPRQEYLEGIRSAGFAEVEVVSESEFCLEVGDGKPSEKVMSITVRALKR